MQIRVTSGTGIAPTALAAFDRALLDAGIANFNLIYLSSIIPKESQIVRTDECVPDGAEWGDRLYVVMAEQRETETGTEAWAGIGWVLDEVGRGLFVEHHGNSQTFIEAQIERSLRSMMESRPGDWGEIDMITSGITCEHDPVCALTAAVYKAERW